MLEQVYAFQGNQYSSVESYVYEKESQKDDGNNEGDNCFDSNLSSASTYNSLNSSPMGEKHIMEADSSIDFVSDCSQDDSSKSLSQESSTELKSLMDAEDELQSIWNRKPNIAFAKVVLAPSQNQTQNRIRRSDPIHYKTQEIKKFEKLVFQPIQKQESFKAPVPERPSNPQGRDQCFNGNYQFTQNFPQFQDPNEIQNNYQYTQWATPSWNAYQIQSQGFSQPNPYLNSNFQFVPLNNIYGDNSSNYYQQY